MSTNPLTWSTQVAVPDLGIAVFDVIPELREAHLCRLDPDVISAIGQWTAIYTYVWSIWGGAAVLMGTVDYLHATSPGGDRDSNFVRAYAGWALINHEIASWSHAARAQDETLLAVSSMHLWALHSTCEAYGAYFAPLVDRNMPAVADGFSELKEIVCAATENAAAEVEEFQNPFDVISACQP